MALAVLSAVLAGIVSFGGASSGGLVRCRGDLVRVRLASSGGAGGEQGQAVVVLNRAHSACAVAGFARLSAFTAAGRKVRVRFVTHTYLAGHPVKAVRIGPDESASFLYDWQDAPSSRPGGGCVDMVRITVGLPDEDVRSRSWHFRTWDYVCQGVISVLPFTTGSHPNGFDS